MRAALLSFVLGCGGAAQPAVAPTAQAMPDAAVPETEAPETETEAEEIAIASDPCEGGEIADDPGGGDKTTTGAGDDVAEQSRPPTPKSGVTLGRPPSASINKRQIQRFVKSKMHHIKACFEKVRQTHPALKGRVVAKWTINADGRVPTATAKGVHADLETCLADRIRTWTFPKSHGSPIKVAYPFVFKRSK